MELSICTDREADTCYVAVSSRIQQDGAVNHTIHATDDISLDFDQDDRLLGIDIRNASKALAEQFWNIKIDSLVGVKEAAEMAGLQRPNFLRDVASRANFPAPVSELPTGRVWLQSQVAQYLAQRPRRSSWRLRLE